MGQEMNAVRYALGRKQHRVLAEAIERWRRDDLIDEPLARRLADSTTVAVFDWKRTARYAFIVSIVCIVIAAGAVLADEWLVRLLMRIFSAPALAKCAFFTALAAGIFRHGLTQRARHPERRYGTEAIFLLGVLALAAAVFFLGAAIDTGRGHYSLLFLIASVLYALLGLWFASALVWVFALLSLGAWMGTETGYLSGHGAYFLGMNYPLRFVLFGAVLAAVGIYGQHNAAPAARDSRGGGSWSRLLLMSPQTTVIGLLFLFVALWILSIFGNYGDMMAWRKARQIELFHWALLFGAAAIAAIWYGLRHDDGVLRGFGLTFLFINLYTRFFEYFWESMHKAAFFTLLAASFWLLGRKAEALWHLGEKRSGTVKP